MEYLSIIKNAKLADYGPVHGGIIILPYGVQIWKRITIELSRILEKTGHEQVYFPLLIPENFFEKEKQWIPELCPRNYTITKVGNNKLNEPLVVRPTSELIASYMFAKWIGSFRDLPIKVFQWVNVVRSEMVTHPFIKGTEIQMLEGHTSHATHESAIKEIDAITDVFYHFFTDFLKIPVIFGEEVKSKRFPGSLSTRTFDTITPNGQALQLAAIYDLGQLFAEQFKIKYRDTDNIAKLCWTTDWGLGFRLIGALALIHSDERGLKLPSTIAPCQVYIILLTSQKSLREIIEGTGNKIRRILDNKQIRSKIITQGNDSLGKVIKETESFGIPISILIGDDEIKNNNITLVLREKALFENRIKIEIKDLVKVVLSSLKEHDALLLKNACDTIYSKQRICASKEEIDDCLINNNWVYAPWCGEANCERKAIDELKYNIRMYNIDNNIKRKATCVFCNKPAKYKILIAHKF